MVAWTVGRNADGCPQGILIMLPPFFAVVIESNFGSVADEFGQGFYRATDAAVPVARQHAVGKRVPANVARVFFSERVLVPP